MDKAEQWLSYGKCTICRRKEYCSKPCKVCRNRQEYELKCHVAQAMFRTMNNSQNRYLNDSGRRRSFPGRRASAPFEDVYKRGRFKT